MLRQAAVKPFPIKAVLNSAVIPIPASQFGVHYLEGEEGVFKHRPVSFL